MSFIFIRGAITFFLLILQKPCENNFKFYLSRSLRSPTNRIIELYWLKGSFRCDVLIAMSHPYIKYLKHFFFDRYKMSFIYFQIIYLSVAVYHRHFTKEKIKHHRKENIGGEIFFFSLFFTQLFIVKLGNFFQKLHLCQVECVQLSNCQFSGIIHFSFPNLSYKLS